MKTPDEYLQQSGAFGSQTLIRKEDAIAAIRAAVKEACREQREICAKEYKFHAPFPRTNIELSIKNAPEPKMI